MERVSFLLVYGIVLVVGWLICLWVKPQGTVMLKVPDATGRRRRPTPLPTSVPDGRDPVHWPRVRRGIAMSILVPAAIGVAAWTLVAAAIGSPLVTRIELPNDTGWEPRPVVLLLIPWLVICLLPIIPLYRLRRVAVLIEERICPWCLYDLRGSLPSEDGRTVCPECSGEWNLQSVGGTLRGPR